MSQGKGAYSINELLALVLLWDEKRVRGEKEAGLYHQITCASLDGKAFSLKIAKKAEF